MIGDAVKNSRLCQLAVKETSEVLQKAALELLYCIDKARLHHPRWLVLTSVYEHLLPGYLKFLLPPICASCF